MSIFARTALRGFAFSQTSLIACPRSFTTFTRLPSRTTQRLFVPVFKRRYANDTSGPNDSATATTTDAELPIHTDTSTEIPGLDSEPAVRSQSASSGLDSVKELPTLGPASENKTLYVGNLFFEVTQDQLKEEFEKLGPVVSVKLISDHRGLSKGFGYVEFADVATATAAIDAYHQRTYEGRRMVVQYHVPRRRPDDSRRELNQPSKTLFIGNLSFQMNDTDLNELFREIKNVLDVRVAIDRRTGQPRGFAHADFIDVKSAQQAKEVLDGKQIYGRVLKIDYSANTRGSIISSKDAPRS